jgi:hypothetical protein
MLRDARGGSYAVVHRRDSGAALPVLVNQDSRNGQGVPCVSFPYDVFERAVLSALREVLPSELDCGNRPALDEVALLDEEKGRVEGKIARAKADYKRTQSADVADVLAEFRKEHTDLTRRLAEARRKADNPCSAVWGQFRDLAAALDAAPDQTAARLKLRAALRSTVTSISLLIVPRGRTRLCAAQVFFEGGATRHYLVLHQPPKAGRGGWRVEGRWRAKSLADVVADADGLDLRDRRQAAALAEVLGETDLVELRSRMAP